MTRWELAMVLLAAGEQGHTSRDEGNDVEVYFEGGAKWRCRWEPLKAGTKTMGLVVWPIEHTKTGNYRIGAAVFVPASAIVALGFEPRRIIS